MDKIILSYQDSCLYESDLAILRTETSWLNDRIISFYFEYLQNEVFESNEILFVGSEVTQAIKMIQNPGEIKSIILDPLDIGSRKFIMFAINDNSVDEAGGSHWSLIVYSRPDKKFYHFDSAGNANLYVCSSFVKIMSACLLLNEEEVHATIQIQCLQQNNSYDCGIYVLCHAELVCKTIMKAKNLSEVPKLSCKSVAIKRQELIEIILSLSK